MLKYDMQLVKPECTQHHVVQYALLVCSTYLPHHVLIQVVGLIWHLVNLLVDGLQHQYRCYESQCYKVLSAHSDKCNTDMGNHSRSVGHNLLVCLLADCVTSQYHANDI